MRFDDEELIHIRHGDRKTVIMGGDDWGTGGHLEAPPAAALEAGPGQPVELMVRCKPYVLLMEPVSVELRLRNTTPVPIPIDPRLDPRLRNDHDRGLPPRRHLGRLRLGDVHAR